MKNIGEANHIKIGEKMGKNILKKTVIDPETGELIKENTFFYYDGFNDKGYKYRFRNESITVYGDTIPSTLSKEAFLLLYMLTEMANEENVLVYRVTRKSKFSTIIYKPMTKEDMMSRLRYKYGENKFDKCWTELKKHCIKKVRYHEYMVWAINPAVISKCKYVPAWLYDEFKLYMNPHLPKAAIKKYQEMLKGL